MDDSYEQRRLRKLIENEERQASLDSPMSKTESFLRGGAQGASLGFADELTGAGEAGLDTLQGNTKPTFEDFINTYKRHRDESRENYKTAEHTNPYSYTGGQVVGGIAPLIASGGAGAGIQGAGRLGAIAGLGVSDQDLTNSDISVADKVKGTGSDMISGAGFGYAAASLPTAFSAIKSKIRPGAAISEVPADGVFSKLKSKLNPKYKETKNTQDIIDQYVQSRGKERISELSFNEMEELTAKIVPNHTPNYSKDVQNLKNINSLQDLTADQLLNIPTDEFKQLIKRLKLK